MYKRLTLDELRNLNTSFFDNLCSLCKRQRYVYFKEFVKASFEQGNRLYFFERNRPTFRLQQIDKNSYRIIDEQEKIELVLDEESLTRLHSFLWDKHKVRQVSSNERLGESLYREFQEWSFTHILDKPYLVYDIETTFDGYNFSDQKFEMAYTIQTDDEHTDWLKYKYVDTSTMKKLCDFLLDYDGWIIWYNQIAFDNPVLVNNVGYGPKELELLNKKSIDPFLVLWKLLGKRMSLQAVASTLISEGKTLSSGKEGEQLLQMYKETGKEKFLKKVKNYCKNDVKITLGVMLYLLKYQQVYLDGEVHRFDIKQLQELGWARKQAWVSQQAQRLVHS